MTSSSRKRGNEYYRDQFAPWQKFCKTVVPKLSDRVVIRNYCESNNMPLSMALVDRSLTASVFLATNYIIAAKAASKI